MVVDINLERIESRERKFSVHTELLWKWVGTSILLQKVFMLLCVYVYVSIVYPEKFSRFLLFYNPLFPASGGVIALKAA